MKFTSSQTVNLQPLRFCETARIFLGLVAVFKLKCSAMRSNNRELEDVSMALRVAKIILLILYLVVVSSEAYAVDGNTWKRMNKGEQYGYILGVVDTWGIAAEVTKTTSPASMGLLTSQ